MAEVRAIERVNAVGADDAPLDLNMAQMAVLLAILLHVVGHAHARETTEELGLAQEALQMLYQVMGEVFHLFLLRFDVVVQEIDFQRVWQLFVQGMFDEITVL